MNESIKTPSKDEVKSSVLNSDAGIVCAKVNTIGTVSPVWVVKGPVND